MLTQALKVFLAGKTSPFRFLPDPDFLPEYGVPEFGIYVHIPFCKSLCSFCPYYKTLHDPDLAESYIGCLLEEIQMVARRLGPRKNRITSVYFGGGSPALLYQSISRILDAIRSCFEIGGHIGVELHPQDARDEVLAELKKSGVTMISLGVQSFQSAQLATLGRTGGDPLEALVNIARHGFESLDVDLIFGIPGQDEDSLEKDFLTAINNGATQVSTYPFIDFSYADNRKKPLGHRKKRRMLNRLLETAQGAGFVRTSVWTFGKEGSPRYSSITRENFLGFGPSATSLGLRDFKVNTFSVQAYIECVQAGKLPTALRMEFNEKTRALYWLFWSCYNGAILQENYLRLFGRSLKKDYRLFLTLGVVLGLLEKYGADEAWTLTRRGSYLFHRVEQIYTHQYIDKTWKNSLKTPWPALIELD